MWLFTFKLFNDTENFNVTTVVLCKQEIQIISLLYKGNILMNNICLNVHFPEQSSLSSYV